MRLSSARSRFRITAVQAQLGDDEVLIVVLDMPESGGAAEETFIWAITKKDARWIRSDLGRKALTREVQALRCGLDYLAWQRPSCRELTGTQYALDDYLDGRPLPFDLARAHRLYKALLGHPEAEAGADLHGSA